MDCFQSYFAYALRSFLVLLVLSSSVRADGYHYAARGSLGLIQPIMLGMEIHRSDYPNFAAYLDGGYFLFPFSTSHIYFRIFSVESGLRYFFWKKKFSFSLGLGYRNILFLGDLSSLKVQDTTIATQARLAFAAFYFSPGIDYETYISRKLRISFGLGVQVPVFVSSSLSFINDQNHIADGLLYVDRYPYFNRVAMFVLPRVTLFKLIWDLD
jgi:hypothetical protein